MVGFPQQASATIATSTTGITTQFVSTKTLMAFMLKEELQIV